MKFVDVLLCLTCVALASTGQVLMRAAALLAAKAPEELGIWRWVNGTTVLAVSVYAVAMVLWLWVLGRVPLTQAIAFFGLTFVIVPVMAARWLGDPLSVQTMLGGLVILIGVMVANWR